MIARSMLLRAPRVTLRPLSPTDTDALARLLTEPRIRATYMIPDFADRAAAERYCARLEELSASESRFVCGIDLDGELIGFLNDCGTEGGRIELGYFISPEHWNRGYATEALRAAIDELFRIGYDTVVAGHFEENPASRRVMEKCGMHPLAETATIAYRGAEHRVLYMAVGAPRGQTSC